MDAQAKIVATYKEHEESMRRKTQIDHVEHQKWTKVYNEDLTISEEWHTRLTSIINDKFSTCLFNADEIEEGPYRRAMFKYWRTEDIPHKTPIFKPIVPWDSTG